MDDLINKWEIMRALQAINPVAKLMDGDLVIKISEVENVLENMPSVKPDVPDINVGSIDTTTHDSIPAETGKNDEDRTSGDCISRQQAIDALNHMRSEDFDGLIVNRQKVESMLKALPSIQSERIKGHWIEIALSNHTYKCSVCGRLLTNITDGKNKVAKNYPYCHCGADMRGGENDGCSQVFEREESDV